MPPTLHKPPCIILAGGLSRRMGSNKALAAFGGKTMLKNVVERIAPQTAALALNADKDWDDLEGLRHVPDVTEGKLGPLAGVLAAMRDTALLYPSATHVLTVPTDAPLLPVDLAEKLVSAADGPHTIVVAKSAATLHPVVALWPVWLADDLQAWIIADEKRRVRRFIERHMAVEVDFPLVQTMRGAYDPFLNINTPQDLVEAERWLEK